MAYINGTTNEIFDILPEKPSGEMDATLSWHEDSRYANIKENIPDSPQIVYERIPLNGTFVDNGINLIYTDINGKATDISYSVQRYGWVNTNKIGEYTIKYVCEYKSWSRFYSYSEDKISADPIVDFRWKKSRKVIVYEPNWLSVTIPRIYEIYPAIQQILQRYQDIFWELNYRVENIRLGLINNNVVDARYRKDWKPPIGKIVDHAKSSGLWSILGCTFKNNDYVEIDVSENHDFKNSVVNDLVIFSVNQENQWSSDHTHTLDDQEKEKWYQEGSWVRYLDKTYFCHKSHNTIQDRFSKIKPKIIYPTDKKYWTIGCRVELARYEYFAKSKETNKSPVKDLLRRVPNSNIGNIYGDDSLMKKHGYAIRQRNIVVDSQGFLYTYNY